MNYDTDYAEDMRSCSPSIPWSVRHSSEPHGPYALGED